MTKCAWTPEAEAAFDPDIYDCPCGHPYGNHDVVRVGTKKRPPKMECNDCGRRTVLAARIAAEPPPGEPTPVPVLPGQRKLPL